MNILIIAKFWDASAGIAALRPMKIAKYLLQNGHAVTVICGKEYFDSDKPCKDLINLRSIEGYSEVPAFEYRSFFKTEDDYSKKRNIKAKQRDQSENISNGTDKTKRQIKQSLPNKIKWRLYKTIYNSLKVKNTVDDSFNIYLKTKWIPDVIISSYAPEEVHFLAAKIKKQYPKAFWIADFRDPMANKTNQKPYEYRYRLKREKRIICNADAVTIVSKTWRDEFRELGGKNVFAVYSGFDRDDFYDVQKTGQQSDKVVLTYTGSLYPGLSDLRPLFKAISELIHNGLIDPTRVKFVYAGNHGEEFDKQAKYVNATVEIDNYGFIPRPLSLQLLKESDVLLHALFCTPGLRGIITGKLGEYWASGKPILTIVTGSVRADEFITIIEKSNTGFVYDGTDEEKSFAELKEYLLDLYNKKINGECLPYNRDENFISNFDYNVIANQFVEIATGKIVQND